MPDQRGDVEDTIALALVNYDRWANGLPAVASLYGIEDAEGYEGRASAVVAALDHAGWPEVL